MQEELRYATALDRITEERAVVIPGHLKMSRSKVAKQLKEWVEIKRNIDGTPVQKAVMHVVYPIACVAVPLVAIVPVVAARVGYEYAVKTHKFNQGVPDREPYICAEELLRHYYNGHKTLGTGKLDGVVAKGSRLMHGRSRHHAGTIQRTFKEYQNKLEQCRAEFGDNPSLDLLNRRGPELLLLSLKEQLIARGRPLELEGDLAAAILVIQDRCQLNVIDLATINTDIAESRSRREHASASSLSSMWGAVRGLNPFGSSSRHDKDSDDELDRDFGAEL